MVEGTLIVEVVNADKDPDVNFCTWTFIYPKGFEVRGRGDYKNPLFLTKKGKKILKRFLNKGKEVNMTLKEEFNKKMGVTRTVRKWSYDCQIR